MDLVLYGAVLSPFVRKAEVVLREKGIEFESVGLNVPVPDWFKEINPAAKMPALRDKDIAAEGPAGVIPDSSAICAYLERAVPLPALYPNDAFGYGRAMWFEEYADSELGGRVGMGIFRPVVFPMFAKQEPDLETARKAATESLPLVFDYLEGELAGREYLLGDALSIADISVVTQLVNLNLAVVIPMQDRWPQLVGLYQRLIERPSFAANIAICKKIIKQPVDLGL
jgi:glutathione S-transferase